MQILSNMFGQNSVQGTQQAESSTVIFSRQISLETLICILEPTNCLKGLVMCGVCARARTRDFPSCGNGSGVFIAGPAGPFSHG